MLTRWYWQHFNHLINSIKIKCGRASTRTEQQFRQLSWDRGLSCNWSSRNKLKGQAAQAEAEPKSHCALTHSIRQSLNQSVHQSVNQAFDKSQSWQWAKRRRTKKRVQSLSSTSIYFSSFCSFLLLPRLPCCVSILKAWHHSGGEYAECVIKLAALQLTQLISCRRKADCMRIITILH